MGGSKPSPSFSVQAWDLLAGAVEVDPIEAGRRGVGDFVTRHGEKVPRSRKRWDDLGHNCALQSRDLDNTRVAAAQPDLQKAQSRTDSSHKRAISIRKSKLEVAGIHCK